MKNARMDQHVSKISPNLISLIRIKNESGAMKDWTVETHATHITIVRKDGDLYHRNTQHKKRRWET